MDERDGDHWLWRFDASAWLAAANHELEQGRAALAVRRSAVTHARRAAGMALNAVLVDASARGRTRARSESIWGRSYIDHLRTLADSNIDPAALDPFDAELGQRCRELLAIPVMAPGGMVAGDLVQLARTRDEAASSALGVAGQIVQACAQVTVKGHKPRSM